jgi:sporulation protein YtfJ
MAQAMENLKSMIDVDTVIGKPLCLGENFVVPISRVTFGFIAGGSEFSDSAAGRAAQKNRAGERGERGASPDIGAALCGYPHAGGSGSVVSINPLGFLVVGDEKRSLIKLNEEEDKWSKAAKNLFSAIFSKKEKEKD